MANSLIQKNTIVNTIHTHVHFFIVKLILDFNVFKCSRENCKTHMLGLRDILD